MQEKRRSPRFDIVLGVKIDLKDRGTLTGTLGNLSASGEGIMIKTSESIQLGDTIALEIPVPVQMQTVQCEGEVMHCQQGDGVYEIGICIRNIDAKSRENLRTFCNFLMPSIGSDTLNYLIQQGEKAL